MADIDFTAEELAAMDRITKYNIRFYDAVNNPYGFGDYGHQFNQMPQAMDVRSIGLAASRIAGVAHADAQRISDAVAAIENGPVSSVNNRVGNVTGLAEKSDLDAAIAGIVSIKPINLVTPAVNATNIGAGGAYTFVVQAFVGDTIGFYSDYGIPVSKRTLNIYEPGAVNPILSYNQSGGGPTITFNFSGSSIATSHLYEFEFVYTDAAGTVVKSQRVKATTAAVFKPGVGEAYQGGFLAFERFGDGQLYDLIIAAKSTEASKQWDTVTNDTTGGLSRTDGLGNTVKLGSSLNKQAGSYAKSVSIGGTAGYLGAVDELKAISSKLKSSIAATPAFQTGGSEVFNNNYYWTSTEISASNAAVFGMLNGTELSNGTAKTDANLVRALKRVALTPPYPIGTAMEGGYLAAYFTDLSSGSPVTYMLIVADISTAGFSRNWDTNSSGSQNVISRTNGVNNTRTNPAFAASLYCYDLVSGGKDDWYLGAIDEMLSIFRMNSLLPAAQRYNYDGGSAHWTSTEDSATGAKFLNGSGAESIGSKGSSFPVRPIRRVVLPN